MEGVWRVPCFCICIGSTGQVLLHLHNSEVAVSWWGGKMHSGEAPQYKCKGCSGFQTPSKVRWKVFGWCHAFASVLGALGKCSCPYQILRYPSRDGVVRCIVGRLPNTNAKVAVASKPLLRSTGRCLAGARPWQLYWEHWASALALTKC